MHALIADVVAVPLLAYGIVFLVMLFEGDIAMLSAFFFVERGALGFSPTLIAVLFGAVAGEALWFFAGRHGGHGSVGRVITRLASPLARFDRHFAAHPFLTLFISKFAYGLHHLVVFRVGGLRGDGRTFARYDVPATLLWIVIVGTLGYLSGASLSLVERHLRSVELALLSAIVCVIIIEHIVARLMRELRQ